MKLKKAILIFIILLFLPINALAQKSITSLLKQVQSSTVLITVYDGQGKQTGQGSGFFITDKGDVITNWHVIKSASSAMVKTATGAIFKVKGIAGKDERRDVAKIVLEAKDVNFPYLRFSEIPEVGERIFVIGSPYGLESTVSDGLVSAIREAPDIGKIIQISAPISPGSSGSPVINSDGKVVGVATFQFIKGQNLNFAMPVTEVARLLLVEGAVTPLGGDYLSKINPEVQLQDNGWIRITGQYVEWVIFRGTKPKVQRSKEACEEIDKIGCAGILHVEVQFLKYAKTIKVPGIEFFPDPNPTPTFSPDYHFKVFVTFYDQQGDVVETESKYLETFEEEEVIPGEERIFIFFIPRNPRSWQFAKSWQVWVPK